MTVPLATGVNNPAKQVSKDVWNEVVNAIPVDVRWYGALGDGATDATSAITTALTENDHIYIPAGTFIVSALVIPANKTISTAGFDTIIKQQSGTGPDIRVIRVGGSNVTIGDISIEGQLGQAGDTTGEQNHGIIVQGNATYGNLTNVKIGNVRATNIRGDAVYIGCATGYTARQVRVGQIYANNCWRNGLSVTQGSSGVDVESVVEIACGQHVLDIEPDTADAVRGVRIGYVRGRYVQFSGTLTAIDGVEIGTLDLDPANGANSTPANPYANNGDAIHMRGAIVRIGRLKINGYTGQAVQSVSGGYMTARLIVDSAEITACCSTDTTYYSYFEGGGVEYDIGHLKATTTDTNHRVFGNCLNSHVGKAEIALVSTSSYMRACTDCSTRELVQTVSGAGNGGIALNGCTRCQIYGGAQTGDRFFSSCIRCIGVNVDATMATSYDSSGTNNEFVASRLAGAYNYFNAQGVYAVDSSGNFNTITGTYSVNSQQVVGARGAALPADATDLATAITLVNAIKARMKTTGGHGLVAD